MVSPGDQFRERSSMAPLAEFYPILTGTPLVMLLVGVGAVTIAAGAPAWLWVVALVWAAVALLGRRLRLRVFKDGVEVRRARVRFFEWSMIEDFHVGRKGVVWMTTRSSELIELYMIHEPNKRQTVEYLNTLRMQYGAGR